MIPVFESKLHWVSFKNEYLPLILHHQKELYSLNFHNMVFDQMFYANITGWYIEGIENQNCYSNLLFTSNQQLVGFYLFQHNETTVYLMQMFVEKSFRKQGYGHYMLRHFEQKSKELEARSSFLHASKMNQQAVSFYLQNGYVILDEEMDEPDFPRYFMFKNLER